MAERAEKRYAILIGSSKYPNEPGLTELRCPEKDVDALNAVLRSPDFGGFTETFAFKNSPSHEILEKIETVLADAGREDLVLIYFSGHGKLNPAGQLCLATVNTKIKALGATSIPVSWIKSYFDHSASQKKILLLDCCYSGAVGKDFIRGGVDDQLQLMSQGQGTFIMTASTGIEVAVEKEGDKYGLFTKHLVYGIQSGEADKDEDGFVDMQELYEYVHKKVQEEGAQEPMKWDLHAKGKLVVARSGKESKKKQRKKIRQKLYGLAAQDALPDDLVAEAMQILAKKELSAREQEQYSLLEQLVVEKIRPADFIVQWMRIDFSRFFNGMNESGIPEEENNDHVQVPLSPPGWESIGGSDSYQHEIPEEEYNDQEQVPLSPPNWGAICEPDVETVGKKIKLLLRFVLAGLIVVIGGWSLKQWEYHPETGLDASSVLKAKKYVDHGDGTITDTKTGLMWKRCSEGLSGVNCAEGKVERYIWNEAVEHSKNVEYAGYADWRLPTVAELKTLVYCSNGVENKKNGRCNPGSEKPTINQQAFPNTEASDVWSGSPYAGSSAGAWYVDFYYGNSSNVNRYFNIAVRLVRSGQ
ncbi:MAG: DUF1566 domain-containing protein [Candidatus Electrothrix sp. AW2]|nr:DUF1566 domain-containing protein [Candidatus Electrothrix gigas]